MNYKMIKSLLLLFLMVFLVGCGSGTKNKQREDGAYPMTFGQIIFTQTEATFCPCDEKDCMLLTGGIQFKAVKTAYWNFQKDRVQDVYANIAGYYFTTDDGKGGRIGNIDIEDFSIRINVDCDRRPN